MAAEVIRLPDAQSLAERLAGDIAMRLADAVEARGSASLAVPGGSTPERLFDALSHLPSPSMGEGSFWSRVHVTLTDERWVEREDPGSNEGLVRRRLLTRHAAHARFVGLRTPHATAIEGVEEATVRLAALPRPFDVVLLGMGDDGHIASLFPGSAALAASLAGDPAAVQAVQAPGARGAAERITLALPTLLASRFIALLITGEEKRTALDRAQAGDDAMEMPVRAVLQRAPSPVHVYWSP